MMNIITNGFNLYQIAKELDKDNFILLTHTSNYTTLITTRSNEQISVHISSGLYEIIYNPDDDDILENMYIISKDDLLDRLKYFTRDSKITNLLK